MLLCLLVLALLVWDDSYVLDSDTSTSPSFILLGSEREFSAN